MNLDKISVVILAAGLGTRLRNFRGGKTNKILLESRNTLKDTIQVTPRF